jgi:chromosome segregation ATPase
MYVVVRFGYKQHRFYNIESLTASLGDQMWLECVEDIITHVTEKRNDFMKIEEETKIKILNLKIKIYNLEEKLKAEEEAEEEAVRSKLKNKGDKKKKKAKPKKGKNENLSPTEQELNDSKEELEKFEMWVEKYGEKLEKMSEILQKYNGLQGNSEFLVDLVDTAGERKYLTAKRDAQASEYLAQRGTYHLCNIVMMDEGEGNFLFEFF